MNNPFNKPLAVLFGAAVIFVAALTGACGNRDTVAAVDTPEILFVHSPLAVDLNRASKPAIISVVKSQTGLSSVSTFILKEGDVEEPFEQTVTSFFDPNSHSINYSPVFTEDMTGFKVVATDRAGQIEEATLPFVVTPLRNPPSVVYNDGAETIPYREGSAMPELKLHVASQEELRFLTLREVVNRSETIVQIGGADTLWFDPGTFSHTFDYADDGFTFKLGTTAIKAAVGAGLPDNMKVKVTTLYVDFTYIPAPVVTFDQPDPVSVNEFASLTLSGGIASESGLTGVQYFTRTADGDTEIAGTSETFTTPKASHDFSIVWSGAEVGVTAIVVKAVDALGKETVAAKDITVVELAPPPVITIDQSDESFNGVPKDSNITLSGSITTEAELTAVKITTVTMAGVSTDENLTVTAGNKMNFPISKSISADETLAGITITSTDINDKVTTKEIKVYVGFKFYRVLASGNGSDSSYSNAETCTCFFSAELGATMGYNAYTMANADKVDVAFATWSTNTQMNIASITCGDLGTKCNHPEYGRNKWMDPVPVPRFLHSKINIKRSTFDVATISDIMAEAAPADIGKRVPITQGNMQTPLDVAILYITKIGGVDKRVLLAYDEFEEAKPNASASTFWIKVKVEL